MLLQEGFRVFNSNSLKAGLDPLLYYYFGVSCFRNKVERHIFCHIAINDVIILITVITVNDALFTVSNGNWLCRNFNLKRNFALGPAFLSFGQDFFNIHKKEVQACRFQSQGIRTYDPWWEAEVWTLTFFAFVKCILIIQKDVHDHTSKRKTDEKEIFSIRLKLGGV